MSDALQHAPLGRPYEALRPRMLAELGRLAGEGVRVAPHDGLDFVHGFFLDEWPRTYATYQAAEGDPWPYVRTAFRRYVRHEVRREARSRYFDAPDPDPASAERDAPDAYDLDRASRALWSLRSPYLDVLRTYLATASERATARRLGLSRARTRDLLEEATARVAAAVEPPPSIADDAWQALLAVYSGAPHDRAQSRLAAQASAGLLRALRESLPTPTPNAPTPVQSALPMTAADLLLPYRTGTPSSDERAALRTNAQAVLDALDKGDAAAVAVFDEQGTSEGYEALYADLAAALESEAGAAPDVAASQSDLDEEAEIGQLFLTLVEAHPQNGASLKLALGGLPEVDADMHARVYHSTLAVASAGPQGAFLASRGLTPMTFFQAADAVGDLVERLSEEGTDYVCLSSGGLLENTEEPETLVVDEVAYVTGLDSKTAQLVLTWLLATATGGASEVFTGVRVEEKLACSAVLRFDPALLDLTLEERWDAVAEED